MDINAIRFEQAVSTLPARLKDLLCNVAESAKAAAFEVRLRVGGPLSICCGNQTWFVDQQSHLHNKPARAVTVSQEEIAEAVVSMCAYSLHSHEDEMRNGFISLAGGHRAGICGTAITSGGSITAVRDITSVNLRVARDLEGVADSLVQTAFSHGLCGLLVAGPPSSGKTTLLRDVARQLAGGAAGSFVKVAVVDERFEMGAVHDGVPQNSLGACCDLLSGYPKAEGIQIALRTLSPQVVICDEIGSSAEAKRMLEGFHCGVKMVASVHAGDRGELASRPQVRMMLEQGAFEKVAILAGAAQPGVVAEIVEAGDLLAQVNRHPHGAPLFYDDRGMDGVEFVEAGIFD